MSSSPEPRSEQSTASIAVPSPPPRSRPIRLQKVFNFKLPGRLVRATICSDSSVPGDGNNSDEDDDDDYTESTIWARFVKQKESQRRWNNESSSLLKDPEGGTSNIGYESLFNGIDSAAGPDSIEKVRLLWTRSCMVYTFLSVSFVLIALYFVYVWRHSFAFQR